MSFRSIVFPNLFKEHDQMELYADIIGKVLSFSAFEKYINPFHKICYSSIIECRKSSCICFSLDC